MLSHVWFRLCMELAAWLLVMPIKPGKEPCPSSSPSTVVAFELPPLCRFLPECRFEGDADDGVPFSGESLELRFGVKLILICSTYYRLDLFHPAEYKFQEIEFESLISK